MRPALRLLAQHKRTPLIKFLGKRTPPKQSDHTPHTHPAAPSSLPDSFANYRSKAQQHGPLGSQQYSSPTPSPSAPPPSDGSVIYGAIGGHSGAELGSIEAGNGEVFDRNQLPLRFRRTAWSEEEIEAVQTGGASMQR